MKSTISKYNILFAVASFILAATFILTFIINLEHYMYDNIPITQIFAFIDPTALSSSFMFSAIGICCLLGTNETSKKIIFSIFLFISSALFLTNIIQFITVSKVLHTVAFAVLGILAIVDKKKTASCIFAISVIATDIIFNLVSISLYRQTISSAPNALKYPDLIELLTRLGFGIDYNFNVYQFFNIFTLLGILAYFIITGIETERKIKTENGSEISLNGDVLDFKTLLSFVENQYRTGEIGEEEYKNKRAEILKNL